MEKKNLPGICQCSFCGYVNANLDRLMISGIDKNVYICSDCVAACKEHIDSILRSVSQGNKSDLIPEVRTPAEIKEILDSYVIGQDDAKIALSVAVYNHYKRILSLSGGENVDNKDKNKKSKKENKKELSAESENSDVEIAKSNVLLLGPTGSGKTLLAQVLAKTLNVPFAIADATTLTEAGYVGEDVENILLRLIQAADGDVEAAERGIIYVDEIDKISRRSENPSITRDVSGEGVQQALLKLIEGTLSNVPPQGGRKHPNQEYIPINTKNILFICGGAFAGLEDIIKKRISGNTIGFENDIKSKKDVDISELLKQCESRDIVKYGLIPELVGRLPVVVSVDKLDKDALIRILNEPKNSLIKQYQKLFEFDNIKLTFVPEAVEKIAELAVEKDTGARGLRSIVEKIMTPLMFSAPSNKNIREIVITPEYIDGTEEEPRIIA